MAPLPAKVFDGAGASQERLRRVLHPLSRRLWKMNIEGLENIPEDGPAIICPNHISFFDSVFVMTFVGEANRVGEGWIRPHDITLSLVPVEGSQEAMVERLIHLGFEALGRLLLRRWHDSERG